ncbi:MAG: EAL domain-containing protein [Methylovulum sp.]|jgi:diguanylate cyclase (GGDEF)-like protein/PAS domain S-box-containing protein|nr:EAL domain-containing protein [Methylovulum sp.]
MRLTILASLFLVALFSFLLLILSHFFPTITFPKESLLVMNGVTNIALLVVFYLKTQEKPVQPPPVSMNHPLPIPHQYNDYWALLQIPNLLCLKDKDGCWLKASDEYLQLYNLQGVDYYGKSDDELSRLPESNWRALNFSAIQDKRAWLLRRSIQEACPVNDAGVESNALEITRTPIFDSEQRHSKMLLTGQKVKVEKLSDWESLAHTLHACHLNVMILDVDFKIYSINKSFLILTGYQEKDIETKPLSAFIESRMQIREDEFVVVNDERCWSCELMFRHKAGHYIPVKLDITEINKDGQIINYFATLLDITRQRQSEKRIMRIANYDELTGLANRAIFFERLENVLTNASSKNLNLVIFFINLDRFKGVNDTLGHEGGNRLLKEVAFRLRSITGNRNLVARLNGDEFVLFVLEDKVKSQAMYSATLAAGDLLVKLANPFFILNRDIFITASIGIALYPEDGTSAEMLLKNADMAMQEAKRQGRNNYQFYRKDLADEAGNRLLTELNLRKALERGELQLYYQPQYYASSRAIFGAEVLIRWLHIVDSRTQMIPPDYFISIAEESGLIVEIGAWILRTACVQLKQWQDQGYSLKQVSVNVSARQFLDDNFLETVKQALLDAGLNPESLELELTESLLAGDLKKIELQLNRLKKMGIKIALDDFGTGYSSLSYLKNLPIDVLKIDQSFIREMTMGSKDARLASAIISMGHSLGQKIIAEGVETEQQLEYLTRRGCDIIQGYYFSPPLPVDKMTAILVAET